MNPPQRSLRVAGISAVACGYVWALLSPALLASPRDASHVFPLLAPGIAAMVLGLVGVHPWLVAYFRGPSSKDELASRANPLYAALSITFVLLIWTLLVGGNLDRALWGARWSTSLLLWLVTGLLAVVTRDYDIRMARLEAGGREPSQGGHRVAIAVSSIGIAISSVAVFAGLAVNRGAFTLITVFGGVVALEVFAAALSILSMVDAIASRDVLKGSLRLVLRWALPPVLTLPFVALLAEPWIAAALPWWLPPMFFIGAVLYVICPLVALLPLEFSVRRERIRSGLWPAPSDLILPSASAYAVLSVFAFVFWAGSPAAVCGLPLGITGGAGIGLSYVLYRILHRGVFPPAWMGSDRESAGPTPRLLPQWLSAWRWVALPRGLGPGEEGVLIGTAALFLATGIIQIALFVGTVLESLR